MAIERFHIHIEQKVLDDLKCRLDHIRWPEQSQGTGWEYGTAKDYLQSLVSYWRTGFDWRKQESALNAFPHFRTNIDGTDIHFVYERGKGKNPIPIILTHGWPDSFFRYQKIIPLLTDPAGFGGNSEDSFDVIVPSIPGFGFSGYPDDKGFNNSDIADLWSVLMTRELGYKQFAAGGGDLGSGITRYLAFNHPEQLIAIHLTDIGIIRSLVAEQDTSLLSGEEQLYKKNAEKWIAHEGGYMSLQSTKPLTLAYGLSDSPVGLAAWIAEKFCAWSDNNGYLPKEISRDELLTNIMIYWVTNTVGSSAHIYYENTHSLPPLGYIGVPTAVALFAADVLLPPKKWAEKNMNIAGWTLMPEGGHFAAMEEPALLAKDIRSFYRQFR
jgi:microsomal epoxide hydrolase